MKRKLHRISLPLAALLSTLLLTACATLAPGYEQPTVSLSSFRAIPSAGMTPSFEIGLQGRYPSLRVRESGAFSLQTLPR